MRACTFIACKFELSRYGIGMELVWHCGIPPKTPILFYSIPGRNTLTCIQHTFTPQSAKFQNHSNTDISIPKPWFAHALNCGGILPPLHTTDILLYTPDTNIKALSVDLSWRHIACKETITEGHKGITIPVWLVSQLCRKLKIHQPLQCSVSQCYMYFVNSG